MRKIKDKIKDKIEILSFKIRTMRLFSRLVNASCKNPEWDTILTEVKMEYDKIETKSGMYPDLVRFLYEQLLIDAEEEE